MSSKILPSTDLSFRNLHRIVEIWSEVYQERGEHIATIGVIQLILDRLKLSMRNNGNENDFQLPETIDLSTFDMENFISTITTNQESKFDLEKQKKDDPILADLIARLVRKSQGFRWIRYVQQFICVLQKSIQASFLLAETMVFLYAEAAVMRNVANLDRNFKDQMRQTCQYVSLVIADNVLVLSIWEIVCDTFFDKIFRRPEIIQNDAEGCERIIVKFLTEPFAEIIIKTMEHMIRCGVIRVHGKRILRFCSRGAIVRELSRIITLKKIIKIKKVALELACDIERTVRERSVFPDEVYGECVRSDNEQVQNLVGELCRVMVSGADTGIADPTDVVLRATMFHQMFRENYTACPKRVIKAFYTEFSNWDAIFEAIDLRLNDTITIDEIFALLKRVIDHIKKTEDRAVAQNNLRSFSHKAIDYVQDLNREHVTVHGNIIFSLLHADNQLVIINNQHSELLKRWLTGIITGYFSDFNLQLNAILMVKVLLPIQVWEAKFDLCLIELRTLLHQPDIDYDKDAIVIELFMKLGVFAWYEMIPKDAALLCNLSNVVVMKTQLNLTQNRTFLAYNLIILVNSCIKVYESAGRMLPESIKGVSRTRIISKLIEILDKTQDDIDFLCVAVFRCISKMERYFKNVFVKYDINVLVKYLVKKINLVAANGINTNQLPSIEFMLDDIKWLLNTGVAIDIRDLAVQLNKSLPEYDYSINLLRFCIEAKNENMFVNCAIGVFSEITTKKSKEDFMKLITNIVKYHPNQNNIWAQIVRKTVDTFGKRAQESADERSTKMIKRTGDLIFNSTQKNWSTVGNQTIISSTRLELNNNNITPIE